MTSPTSISLSISLAIFLLTQCLPTLCLPTQGVNDLIFKQEHHAITIASAKSSTPSPSSGPFPPINFTSVCPEILSKCSCGIQPYGTAGRPTYLTNCTLTGFTGNPEKYLQTISNETEVLIFTGNNFTELPANLLLLNKTYDNLHVVDLSNNNIRTIHGKAFHNMKSVRILYLNDNNLTLPVSEAQDPSDDPSLHPRMFAPLRSLEDLFFKNAFDHAQTHHGQALMSALRVVFIKSNLTNLKSLNLESNGLTTLGTPDVFCTLPGLQSLRLGFNSLSAYQINGSCLAWLSYVDLSSNFISLLDARSLSLLQSSGARVGKLHFNFSANPFRCDCSLLPFFRLLRASNSEQGDPRTSPKFESQDRYRCSRSSAAMDIKGQYFDDLSEPDFDCATAALNGSSEGAEAIRRYRHYITLSYFILVLLLLLLAFLVGVLGYTNRDYLTGTWRYFMAEYNSKADYTALDKEGPNTADPGTARGADENSHLGGEAKAKASKKRSHIRMRDLEEDASEIAEEQV